MTWKIVTIAKIYATSLAALTWRFTRLRGLELKGKLYALEFSLVLSN